MSEKFEYRIVRHLTVLDEKSGGWKTELNLVSWNHREPKLDIRQWDSDHEKMSKGITLTYEAASSLCRALKEYLREGKA